MQPHPSLSTGVLHECPQLWPLSLQRFSATH
jgi:hypothetical protein